VADDGWFGGACTAQPALDKGVGGDAEGRAAVASKLIDVGTSGEEGLDDVEVACLGSGVEGCAAVGVGVVG